MEVTGEGSTLFVYSTSVWTYVFLWACAPTATAAVAFLSLRAPIASLFLYSTNMSHLTELIARAYRFLDEDSC